MICRNQSDRGPLDEEEEEEKKENKCGPLLTGRLDGARQKKWFRNLFLGSRDIKQILLMNFF